MLLDIIIGLCIAAIILFIIWSLRGLLLLPVRYGSNTAITIEVKVRGHDDTLENTLQSLSWLRENGTLKADIVISADEAEERRVAELYARDKSYITFC